MLTDSFPNGHNVTLPWFVNGGESVGSRGWSMTVSRDVHSFHHVRNRCNGGGFKPSQQVTSATPLGIFLSIFQIMRQH